MACGLWPMACGLWPVAYGLWPDGLSSIELKPNTSTFAGIHAPAVGERADEHQAPAAGWLVAIERGRAEVLRPARAVVAHLHAHTMVRSVHVQLHTVVRPHAPMKDAVRYQLAHEQPQVIHPR